MFYLKEIIYQKRMIDDKIIELRSILQEEQSDDLAQELFLLIEQRQNLLLKIQTANNASTLNIGGTDVTISTALIIRETINEKITVLTNLINNRECNLNKMELQKQRDKHFEEYTLLSMGIERNDLQVQVK